MNWRGQTLQMKKSKNLNLAMQCNEIPLHFEAAFRPGRSVVYNTNSANSSGLIYSKYQPIATDE